MLRPAATGKGGGDSTRTDCGGGAGGASPVVAAATPRHQQHQLLEDRLVGVGAGAGSVHNRVLGGAVLLGHQAPQEDLLEGLPELARHPTVDAKVNGVTDHQEEVRQQDADVGQAVVQELDDQRAHNVHDGHHGNGYLGQQEHRDDHDQHQGGAVALPQLLALLLPVLPEEQLAPLLRLPHGGKQQDVQRHQDDAGQQVDKEYAEQVVAGVVQVHANVLVHPQRRLQVAHLRLLAVPLDLHGHVRPVEEPGQLVEECQQGDVRRAALHPRHRAPGPGHRSMAHVDVPANELNLNLNLM